MSDEWRRACPPGNLYTVLSQQPPNTGVSVYRALPYWDVVARIKRGTSSLEYIVTDSSRPGQKPLRVYGPVAKKQEAVEWAAMTAKTFITLKGGMIEP